MALQVSAVIESEPITSLDYHSMLADSLRINNSHSLNSIEEMTSHIRQGDPDGRIVAEFDVFLATCRTLYQERGWPDELIITFIMED